MTMCRPGHPGVPPERVEGRSRWRGARVAQERLDTGYAPYFSPIFDMQWDTSPLSVWNLEFSHSLACAGPQSSTSGGNARTVVRAEPGMNVAVSLVAALLLGGSLSLARGAIPNCDQGGRFANAHGGRNGVISRPRPCLARSNLSSSRGTIPNCDQGHCFADARGGRTGVARSTTYEKSLCVLMQPGLVPRHGACSALQAYLAAQLHLILTIPWRRIDSLPLAHRAAIGCR